MPELPLSLVLEATGGRLIRGPAPDRFRGVSTDTRALTAGSLFAALRGERFDGHDFAAEALRRGAGAALVAREVEGAGPLILVEDTLAALGKLAAAHRAKMPAVVVAITGSTGKTTTKEMAAAILARGGATAKTPGNYNNEIGVPLALLGLEADHRAAVVELAMRGRGQIAYLADMARPRVGVITNIGVSHLELLGSKKAIAEVKAELLAALPADGAAVLNADDEFVDRLRAHSPARVVTFGRSKDADVRVEEATLDAAGRVRCRLRGWWGEQEVMLKAAGRHHALNAAAAAAAAMLAGGRPEWVEAGLTAFQAADMRGQLVAAPGGYTVINDCYNAAPDSMRVALELLMDLPGRAKWAALGDMRELGAMAAEWHREVGELAGRLGLSGLVGVGEMGRLIADGARAYLGGDRVVGVESNAAAAELLRERLGPGDVVLVKGSRLMQMEEIVSALVAEREGGGDE